MPVYTSRASKILALVPKNPCDSGEEDEVDNMPDEELMNKLNEMFDVEDQEEDELQPETTDLPQVESVDPVDSDGPVEEELLDVEMSAVVDGPVWEGNDLIVLAENSSQNGDMDVTLPRTMAPASPATIDSLEPSSMTAVPSTSNKGLSRHRRKKGKFLKVKPLKKPAVKTGRIQKKTKLFKWKKTSFRFCVQLPDQILPAESMEEDEDRKPIHYFKRFVTDDLLQMIVEESNRYSIQQKGTSAGITANDIRDFLAIEISMGIVKIRCWKSYWAAETRVERVAKVMSRNKYAKIRSSLHFADNNGPTDPNDRYFKIRPVAEYIRQKFISIEGIDRKFSVDEMMIAYKGKKAGSRRQYMPKKPTKWGFKVYARCGVSGVVYDFFFYAGQQSFYNIPFNTRELEENFSTKCVRALCKSLENPALSAVFFDNFFSSPRLIRLLRYEYGILSLGTLRANRLDGAEQIIDTDKELLKRGRGSHAVVSDNSKKLTIVKWADTKVVTLASSYVSVEPIGEVRRWSVTEKKKTSIPTPKIVKEYNAFMGGVDKADMLTALYKTPLRTFKWYMAIFAQLIDLSLSNAWLLFCIENPKQKMSLVEFKIAVSNSLVIHKRMKRTNAANVSPHPCDEQRLQEAKHLPTSEKKGKCRLCHVHQTIWACASCNVRLCVTPHRNCFMKYHTEKELPKRKYTKKLRVVEIDGENTSDEENCDQIEE